MATAVPVADGLCRGTQALGRQMECFNPCAAGACVAFPCPASLFKETLLCSLMVNYLSFRRKNRLPYSKNLRTPNEHWPLPTRTKKNCSRRLGNTTLSLSSDSRSAWATERRDHQQQCRLGRCRGASRGGSTQFTPCVLPAGC